jgi:hypothetical protein
MPPTFNRTVVPGTYRAISAHGSADQAVGDEPVGDSRSESSVVGWLGATFLAGRLRTRHAERRGRGPYRRPYPANCSGTEDGFHKARHPLHRRATHRLRRKGPLWRRPRPHTGDCRSAGACRRPRTRRRNLAAPGPAALVATCRPRRNLPGAAPEPANRGLGARTCCPVARRAPLRPPSSRARHPFATILRGP